MTTQAPEPGPLVSVVIPAYNSHDTIARSLESLEKQTFRDFEVVVVDSGPDHTGEHLARERFPWVRFERSPRRLLPHAARNRGVELARGPLLVFTDPDCYAAPDWLERLVETHRREGGTVVGALACHGRLWRDQGIHLCKFSKWLPGGAPHPVDMSPTANMLLPRALFGEAGGLPGEELLGDVTLSWTLREKGYRLLFDPGAVVEHHHLQSVKDFFRERYSRGILFANLRCSWRHGRRGPVFVYLVASVIPVRLPRILGLVAAHCWRGGRTGWLLATLPLVAAGHVASLAGEAVGYVRCLLSARPGHHPAPAGGGA